MHIGEQLSDLSDRKLTWAAQLGVEHVCVNSLKDTGIQQEDGTWRAQPIKDLIKRLAGFGMTMAGVNLAVHPHDPALPRQEGLRGVHSILGTVDGMKRWVREFDSARNGFNFCQGTLAEMCENPAKEVPEAVRYFASNKRIFMVHFRNIKGGYLNFEEVYPDNGDVDFFEVLKVYREAGYNGMFCPDHVPVSEADPDG